MEMSEQINELAAAMALAQGELEPAPFDSINPHFKSEFASLVSCTESSKKVLSKHGVAVVQFATSNITDGTVGLITLLLHKSGQWMRETLWVKSKSMLAQDVGSCITYTRRYGRNAATGQVADKDDDGNQAQGLSNAANANSRLSTTTHKPDPAAPPPKQESNPHQSADAGGEIPPNADYIVQVGKKHKGKKLAEIHTKDLRDYVQYFYDESKKSGKSLGGPALEFLDKAEPYLAALAPQNSDLSDLPF